MTTNMKPTSITEFEEDSLEDAAALQWLAEKLAPAKARSQSAPSADAIARMRERVLDAAARKSKIAA
jgi:hypothetical protein